MKQRIWLPLARQREPICVVWRAMLQLPLTTKSLAACTEPEATARAGARPSGLNATTTPAGCQTSVGALFERCGTLPVVIKAGTSVSVVINHQWRRDHCADYVRLFHDGLVHIEANRVQVPAPVWEIRGGSHHESQPFVGVVCADPASALAN